MVRTANLPYEDEIRGVEGQAGAAPKGAAGRKVAVAEFPATRMVERFELAYRRIASTVETEPGAPAGSTNGDRK